MKLSDLVDTPVYFAPYNDVTQTLSKLFKHVKGFIDQSKQNKDIIDTAHLSPLSNIIVYSPNYWLEITQKLHMHTCYVVSESNGTLLFTLAKNFTGYTPDSLCKQAIFNNTAIQKEFWIDHFEKFKHTHTDIEHYGYAWGDPEKSDDPLGNYLSIKHKLDALITPQSTVLELGTLNGKWTRYLLEAKKVICVDINTEFITWISERYSNYLSKISFYITQGDELAGIEGNSVDLVFSIDTLVRVEKESIYAYLHEIKRVLKPKGVAILHLPNSDIEGSKQRGFIPLCTHEISEMIHSLFDIATIDSLTLKHGSLIILEK